MKTDELMRALRATAAEQQAEPAPPSEPLDDAALDALTARLAQGLAQAPASPTAPANEARPAPDADRAELRPLGPARRRGRLWPVVLAAAALAAALTLLMVRQPPAPEPPPAYAMTFVGGDQSQRGDPPGPSGGVRRLSRGSSVDLVLRPSTAARGVDARVAVAAAGQPPRLVRVQVEASSEGAMLVRTGRDELFGAAAPGFYEIVALVGERPRLPDDDAALRRALEAPERAGVRVLRQPVELLP